MTRYKYKLACDFETTVTGESDQAKTEVWAFASVELSLPDEYSSVTVGNSIVKYFEHLFSYKGNTLAYFHNEKFDGSFILDYLLKNNYKFVVVDKDKEIPNDSFTCLITGKGLWYNIKIRKNDFLYEIRDSLKLLPFSLDRISKSYNTKHSKLSIDYVG